MFGSAFALLSRPVFWNRLLISLLATVCFLLGCYEMGDSDIWWHLRGGQYILCEGHVPRLDPFTFGSQDRVWVDIHWLFEVLSALVYHVAQVPGLVLMAAAMGTAACLVGLSASWDRWPVAWSVFCWLPALILTSFRFDPRPEIYSLFFVAVFLTVLLRVPEQPCLAWLLPICQLAWVNMQGMFILGPVLVTMFLAAQGADWAWTRWRTGSASSLLRRQVLLACCAVYLACFANPYGLDGVRFPFHLYPKVASAGNIYKDYIDELHTPFQHGKSLSGQAAGINWYLGCLYLLLCALPWSFVFPALWRACQAAVPPRGRPRRSPPPLSRTGPWVGAVAGVFGLLLLSTVTLPGLGAPSWVSAASTYLPLLFLAAAFVSAVRLAPRSREAAVLTVAAGCGSAGWCWWLRAQLTGEDPGMLSSHMLPFIAAAALLSTMLVLRGGGQVFPPLVAGGFGYLAIQALQNISRFGLVAGTLLAWNLATWHREAAGVRPVSTAPPRWIRYAPLGAAALLALWIVALVTNRYHPWTGVPRRLSLREQPLEFARDAIQFAGGAGLPDRALVYDLGQTGLFTFLHAPEHKAFMDGRLEMPDQKTFESYVAIERWLDEQDPRWARALHDLGDPLLLLTHESNAGGEAAVLMHPEWRCIYFDALAAVVIPAARIDLATTYPSVDFAARHFQQPRRACIPSDPGAAFRELRALYNLGAALRRAPGATWNQRVPLMFHALDRGALALEEEPNRAPAWTVLGSCYWNMVPNLKAAPLTPADDWEPADGLAWAQATYCFRRALELAPRDATTLRYLYDAFRARHMTDAQLAIGEELLAGPPVAPELAAEVRRLRRSLEAERARNRGPGHHPIDTVTQLLRAGRTQAAVRFIDEGDDNITWTWPLAERVGAAYLHLGRPAQARRAWERAQAVPSETLRRCRYAQTYWVERDFQTAGCLLEQARQLEPEQAEAEWTLAMLHAEMGNAAAARAVCTRGLRLRLTDRQRATMQSLAAVLERVAASPDGGSDPARAP
jgi:tetratricopeptide (TPR) repeat protein